MLKTKMTWYELSIEPRWGAKKAFAVRKLIYLLRNNGFNTTSCCAHEKWVEMEQYLDEDVATLHNLLWENGYHHFRINTSWEVRGTFAWNNRGIRLEFLRDKDGKTEI